MKITSPSFGEGEEIPQKFTCQGEGVNPELKFSEIPENTKSLALIMDDPDARIGVFTHWVVFNISPETTGIEENSNVEGFIEGLNSAGEINYVPSCPTIGSHHYTFKLFALNNVLSLSANVSRQDLEKEINAHLIEKAELTGTYEKK